MNISRRSFLIAGSLAATTSSRVSGQTGQANKSPALRIGCQTNAWRINPREFAQLLGVLDELKKLDYAGFETGFRNVQGQFGNAAEARRQIEKTKLIFYGAHIFLDKYDADTNIAPFDLITQIVDGSAALGAQRLILSGAPVPFQNDRLDESALRRKVDGLNAAGEYAASKGLSVNYHNHGPEFARDAAEIENLFRLTDRRTIRFTVDCGHAFRAKVDVARFFARHHERIDGLHLRDFRGDEQVPLGQGDFDTAALAAAIKKADWRGWVLNEEERADGSKPGAIAVTPARATLKKIFGT